ncbi:hypothetical protein ZWY2020_057611 [Hordeum vulgare]|nr:hypothetical protein ZWY2020_057611 [Hordeum vulgare]
MAAPIAFSPSQPQLTSLVASSAVYFDTCEIAKSLLRLDALPCSRPAPADVQACDLKPSLNSCKRKRSHGGYRRIGGHGLVTWSCGSSARTTRQTS